MEAQKAAGRIKRAKGTKKDRQHISVIFWEGREDVLKAIVLSLQPRSYTLNPRGLGDSLKETVGEIAGVFAESDVNERLMRGISAEFPERVKVAFTLGLDEVIILPNSRKSKGDTRVDQPLLP